MRFITRNHLTAAILAAVFALPVAARAASDTTAAATTAAPIEQTAGSHREKVEQRIADMHATLHITAAQEPQWDSFSQVMLDNAQAMEALAGKNADPAATRTATQVLQTYAAVAVQHATNVQKLSTAFDALYAGLTADQQKSADEMFRTSAAEHPQKTGG